MNQSNKLTSEQKKALEKSKKDRNKALNNNEIIKK
jgi:hypothetical protein